VISIYSELEKQGVPAAKFERVHAPIGLDIGARTPEEIAIAIAAELIAINRHAELGAGDKMRIRNGSEQEDQAEQPTGPHAPAAGTDSKT
jgi:xanthine/CO dehydrogenase XdhC/CoxF family maturation factor